MAGNAVGPALQNLNDVSEQVRTCGYEVCVQSAMGTMSSASKLLLHEATSASSSACTLQNLQLAPGLQKRCKAVIAEANRIALCTAYIVSSQVKACHHYITTSVR